VRVSVSVMLLHVTHLKSKQHIPCSEGH